MVVCVLPSLGRAAEPIRSPEMRAIGVDEKRGEILELDLDFVDHRGQNVRLKDFFDGERPVMLTLNYFRCRVVCSVQLNGLGEVFSNLDWTAGDRNFRVVTISIDAHEKPKDAAKKRESLLEQVGRGDDVDWQFLTGDELTIQVLAAQLGISFAYDAEQDQFAHPAVAVFVSPNGKIVQYLPGLTFDPGDVKLALLEAGEGKIGTPLEKVYQSCFIYDASAGRYGPFAFGIMRVGGVITVLLLAGFLIVLWQRERRKSRASSAHHAGG